MLVKKWKLCDEVKGVLFGSTQSTAAINLISRGIVTCYAYDHLHNRDLVRQAHNDEFAHVMVMESLFTSEENSLIEYNLDKKNNKVKFVEYEDNPNKEIIHEFHNGMMEYVDQLEKHRKPFRKYLPMSAVDAFEPMNIILQNGEYIARIIGDVLDTPYQVAGLNIPIKKYVPLGEILLEKGIIKQWPFN